METRRTIFLFVFFIILAIVTVTAHSRLAPDRSYCSVASVLSGNALVEIQRRVLTPLVIGAVARVVSRGLPRIAFVVETTSMFISFALFFVFLKEFYDETAATVGVLLLALSLIAAGIQYLSVIDTPHGQRFPADLTQVMFFVMLVYVAAASQAPVLWYPLFILATLNRETTVALIPALFVLWRSSKGTRSAVIHAVVSLLLFAAIQIAVHRYYPGETFDNKLFSNISWLAAPSWNRLLSLAIVFSGSWLFLASGAARCPVQLRQLLWAALFYVGAMVLCGNIHELRIWNELAVVVLPAMVAGMTAPAKTISG
jgi:hypothetical protein